MVPLETPVSLSVVVMILGLIALFINWRSKEGEAVNTVAQEQLTMGTQCERLVIRYLLNDKDTFEKLTSAVERLAGARTYHLLLDCLTGFLNYDSSYRLDRAYALHGMTLEKLGKNDDAEISFASSILLNNHNCEARKGLLRIMMAMGQYDKALCEADKALRITNVKAERDFYLATRKKICELRENARENSAKVRPFNGLASRPGFALVTGHPKARSGV